MTKAYYRDLSPEQPDQLLEESLRGGDYASVRGLLHHSDGDLSTEQAGKIIAIID